ncbi:MAG: carboxypeptidase-like regulatory domain-containing protein, partial [Bryobacteraceae bacterium]|nr:carboxypeptidase-like regulatory domain-containing protein [Bryobacteraceae bacterium]
AAAAAQVSGSVTNAAGQPLEGTMEIIQMDGRKQVKTGEFRIAGGRFGAAVPATARLRATAPGYTSDLKSVFMDYAPLLNGVLNMTPEQLSDWETFEAIRRTLRDVRIDFRLQGGERQPAQ